MPKQPRPPVLPPVSLMTVEELKSEQVLKFKVRVMACRLLMQLDEAGCDPNETFELRFDFDNGGHIALYVGPMTPAQAPADEQPRVNGEHRNGVHPSPK